MSNHSWKLGRRAFALLLVLGGCQSTEEQARQARRDFNRELRTVRPEDGVDLREAELLACGYFQRFISGCGVTGRTFDRGSYFETETYIGYAGAPGAPIVTDKQSGRVSWPSGPVVESPAELEMEW